MDLKAAFASFLASDELTAKAGLSDNNRRQLKHRLANNDDTLRPDTMRTWLLKAGFKEMSFWSFPK